MKLRNSVCLMILSAALAACAVTHTDSGTKAAAVKGGILGLSTVDNAVVDNAKAFSGKSDVVIGSFKVAFLESKKASNKAGGGLTGNGFGGKSSASMELQGLDMATMQFITDQAYADFMAQMQSKGYTIVDRSALLSDPDFAKAGTSPSPLKEEASFFGAAADTTYMTPTGFGPLHFFLGEYGKTGGFGSGNPLMAADKFARSNTPVISVAYTIDFANTTGHGGTFSMSSSLQVGQGISVAPGGGIIFLGGAQQSTFGANGNGSVKLGQAVSSDAPYGTVENTSTGAGIALETAVNVIGALGGIGTNQSRSFVITADPAKYKDVALSVLQQANAQLVGKMAALK